MIQYYRYLFVKKKVFNYSELHFSEVSFYKIHTLGIIRKKSGYLTSSFTNYLLFRAYYGSTAVVPMFLPTKVF